MRYIERLPKPTVLEKKEKEWTQKFLNNDKKRPDNSKYAHKEIKETLQSCSHHKCFYCEQKLVGLRQEVDHYIEVAKKPELAFDWTNLYLSCDICNSKMSNLKIGVEKTLNPCLDSDEKIQAHLTFEDEIICAENGSILGLKTIQKYKLNSERLDLRRSKALKNFHKLLINLLTRRSKEQRTTFSENEMKLLNRFQQKDHEFSLMFKILLRKLED